MCNTESREDLADLLKPGTIVQHFKREENLISNDDKNYLYKLICIAYHTETCERIVVYKALYGKQTCFARPYKDFINVVDKEKYPNVRQKYRFIVHREVTK